MKLRRPTSFVALAPFLAVLSVASTLAAQTAGGRAPANDHWAFQPVRRPAVPEVLQDEWVRTPVDAFVLARLEKNGLAPSPPATRRTLIRRATFDLLGLPPTPREIADFEADDAPDAFAKVVDRLLASPRYGERWGRHWLDVARYADTKGNVYGTVEPRFIHSDVYRDWVIRAFNEDLPYDEFLRQQIAGDRLRSTGNLEPLAALGFLTLGERFLQNPHDIIDDRIDVVTRGTMALTVSCARCHDHEYDPIPMEDYYSLYGIFDGSALKRSALPAEQPGSEPDPGFLRELRKREYRFRSTFDRRRGEVLTHLRTRITDYLSAVLDVGRLRTEEFVVFADSGDVNPAVVRKWWTYLNGSRQDEAFQSVFGPWQAFARMESLPEQAAEWISENADRLHPRVVALFHPDPPESMREVAERYGKLFESIDRQWQDAMALLPCHAPEPDSLPDPADEALRQVLYGPRSPISLFDGDLEEVEWYFRETVREELRSILAEVDRWIIRSNQAPRHAVYLEDRPLQYEPRLFRRGNPADRGPSVPRRFLGVLSGEQRESFENGSGRLELAHAITDDANPLTARVWVNRVWLHHFGAGLVTTPSDFGLRSDPPSHPRLLDWLADRLIADGWSTKKLHRRLMLSSVYMQAGHDRPECRLDDPANRLLWRANPRRLDFETLRDSILAVSNRLDLTIGGRPDDLTSFHGSTRRTIYGLVERLDLPHVFRTFDFPDPHAHCPQRQPTIVPQQALFLMNDRHIVDCARALMERPEIRERDQAAERIGALYSIVYGREPTEHELALGERFVATPSAAPPPAEPGVWTYGHAAFDAATATVSDFQPAERFIGGAWKLAVENGPALEFTRHGGIVDVERGRVALRRWTAPRDGEIAIEGPVVRERKRRDFVARIVSSRHGELLAASGWVPDEPRATSLHEEAPMSIERTTVREGDTIDFAVELPPGKGGSWYIWAPIIRMEGDDWVAERDFTGPAPDPLTPWERFAHTLLLSNEFVYVE